MYRDWLFTLSRCQNTLSRKLPILRKCASRYDSLKTFHSPPFPTESYGVLDLLSGCRQKH
jgi:hypothetical protein